MAQRSVSAHCINRISGCLANVRYFICSKLHVVADNDDQNANDDEDGEREVESCISASRACFAMWCCCNLCVIAGNMGDDCSDDHSEEQQGAFEFP
jgi:hypothetical protein